MLAKIDSGLYKASVSCGRIEARQTGSKKWTLSAITHDNARKRVLCVKASLKAIQETLATHEIVGTKRLRLRPVATG